MWEGVGILAGQRSSCQMSFAEAGQPRFDRERWSLPTEPSVSLKSSNFTSQALDFLLFAPQYRLQIPVAWLSGYRSNRGWGLRFRALAAKRRQELQAEAISGAAAHDGRNPCTPRRLKLQVHEVARFERESCVEGHSPFADLDPSPLDGKLGIAAPRHNQDGQFDRMTLPTARINRGGHRSHRPTESLMLGRCTHPGKITKVTKGQLRKGDRMFAKRLSRSCQEFVIW